MRPFLAVLIAATTLSSAAFAQPSSTTAPATTTPAQTQTPQAATEESLAAQRKEYEKTLMEREANRRRGEVVSHGKMLATLYAKPVNPSGSFKNPKCMPAVVPLKNGRGKSIICTGFIQ